MKSPTMAESSSVRVLLACYCKDCAGTMEKSNVIVRYNRASYMFVAKTGCIFNVAFVIFTLEWPTRVGEVPLELQTFGRNINRQLSIISETYAQKYTKTETRSIIYNVDYKFCSSMQRYTAGKVK